MGWLIDYAVELNLSDVRTSVALVDILLRSLLLYWLACFINEKLSIHATSNSRHRFLSVVLLLIGLLPVLPSLIDKFVDPTAVFALVLLLFKESSIESIGSESQFTAPDVVLATVYCLGVLYCLSKLCIALFSLRELRNSANFDLREEDFNLLKQVQSELNVQSAIGLAKSPNLQSPITFGIVKPLILIPEPWHSWSQSEKLTVLRHEIAHVKRQDWVANIIFGVLASLNWFNPFIWLLRTKVHAEAEHDCDVTVLNLGSPKYAYAGQLLSLARGNKSGSALMHGTASMIEVGELTDRIDAILNYRARQTESTSWFIKAILVTTLGFASFVSFGKAVTVEDAAMFREAQLVYTEQPIYVSSKVFNGLEARTRLRFDVDEQGRVIAESIKVLRSSSPDVMVPPTIAAIKQFRFQPRIEHGQAVVAADMEYEFSIGVYESSFNNR